MRVVTAFRIDLFEEVHHFVLAATLLTSFLPTSAAAIATMVFFNRDLFYVEHIIICFSNQLVTLGSYY